MSVVEQYLNLLGPLRPLVAHAAAHLSSSLTMLGLPAPSEPTVAVAVATIVGVLTLSLLLSLAGSLDLSGLFPLGRLLSRGDRRRRRDAVVIVGVSGGGDGGSGGSSDQPAVGKTTLFKALTGSGRQPTHGTTTSMKTNIAPLQLYQANTYMEEQQHKQLSSSSSTTDVGNNYDATQQQPTSNNIKNTPVMDCPGHPRLRHKLPAALRSAKAILFVIDAHRFATRARHDALLLYDILTHPFVAGGNGTSDSTTPIAIIVNKRDLMPAQRLPLSAVRARLEAELDRVRKASDADMSLRSHTAVGGTYSNYGDDDDNGDGVAAERRRRRGTMYGGGGGEEDGGTDDQEWERVPIGYENEAFAFDQIPGRIELMDASAILGDVAQVTTFLEECLV